AEGQPAIARRMFMPALDRLRRIAQQQRARSHDLAIRRSTRSPVLKTAGQYDGDGDVIVLFLERPVVRTARADDVLDGPATTAREDSWFRATRAAACGTHGQRLFQIRRTFC